MTGWCDLCSVTQPDMPQAGKSPRSPLWVVGESRGNIFLTVIVTPQDIDLPVEGMIQILLM